MALTYRTTAAGVLLWNTKCSKRPACWPDYGSEQPAARPDIYTGAAAKKTAALLAEQQTAAMLPNGKYRRGSGLQQLHQQVRLSVDHQACFAFVGCHSMPTLDNRE
jgi:hypothetical protein